ARLHTTGTHAGTLQDGVRAVPARPATADAAVQTPVGAESRNTESGTRHSMSNTVFIGNRQYFPGIGRINYEGPQSDNPLAFKAYDATRQVGSKTMAEHLRFAVCYWHTFCGDGADPFGPGTRVHAWKERSDPMDAARDKLDAAFEFFTKLGVPYYCFHDRDLAPEGSSVAESEKQLAMLVELAKERQQAT